MNKIAILFDANPPYLRWCTVINGVFTEHTTEFRQEWLKEVQISIGEDISFVTMVGYLVHNGGKSLTDPVTRLTQEILSSLSKGISITPEYNNIIVKIAHQMRAVCRNADHILFCDTAFFLDMPAEASTYAVPFDLLKTGVRRYGGYGLCHQMAWQQACLLARPPKKLISVYLGDRTNIAAVVQGKPRETTIGFTPVEGIPSVNSCGDMDPTIVFQLHSMGMAFEAINEILSTKSGFTGLSGRSYNYQYLVNEFTSDPAAAIPALFLHHTIEYIGAFIAVSGGIDTLVFTGEHIQRSIPIITDICRRLSFLGIQLQEQASAAVPPAALSSSGAEVTVLTLEYNKWKNMYEKAIV